MCRHGRVPENARRIKEDYVERLVSLELERMYRILGFFFFNPHLRMCFCLERERERETSM